MSGSPTSIKLVYGLEETKKDLLKLRRNIRRNVLRRAVRAGAVVIQKEARRRAPVRTGALRKAIAVRADNTPYSVRGMVYISSRVKMRASAGSNQISPMLTSKANEAIWPIAVLAMLMIRIRTRAI